MLDVRESRVCEGKATGAKETMFQKKMYSFKDFLRS